MNKTAVALLALCLPLWTQAAAPRGDVAGAADHPLLKRFSGSQLVGYDRQDWAARTLPDASGVKKDPDRWAKPLQVEGKVTRLFYLAPLGKSPLEVFRNHQQALQAAGFKTRWTCESEQQGCATAYFALSHADAMKGMSWAEGGVPGRTQGQAHAEWPLAESISYEEGRMLVGTLSQGGSTVQVLLYSSVAANEYTKQAATYIEIVEPKAMTTGQVSVDAKAIGQGLKDEGRIALYGLFFDTGKSELKPESQAQLSEMLATLKAQPALKVHIVGHTDNVGLFDANQALSLARAQAVVAALGKAGIAPQRLAARGVASLSPVASNGDEAGRARNRRVEMVLQ